MNDTYIEKLATAYKKTEEDIYIRKHLSDQLWKLISESGRGEIAIADFTERLNEITSQADQFMRLIK